MNIPFTQSKTPLEDLRDCLIPHYESEVQRLDKTIPHVTAILQRLEEELQIAKSNLEKLKET